MVQKIERDVNRFRNIVRGKVRENLRKYVSRGEQIGRQGKDFVSIPMPQLDIPHFRYGNKGNGGVSSGDGDEGDAVSPGDEEGQGQAGKDPGKHILEVELTLDEMLDIIAEELALPAIKPKGAEQIEESKDRYTGVRPTGPESLRHFKRTYKQALKRQIVTGDYSPGDPRVVPIRSDERYRSARTIQQPRARAVIFYAMDVSGSMGDEQKEIVRIESFWIDSWLRRQYKGIATRYIVHDAEAREVDRETFFRVRESGGTVISTAYKLIADLIEKEYSPAEWNIYALHFSDGDNWGEDDKVCLSLLKDRLLPACNQFGYGQVASPYGSGRFIDALRQALSHDERLAISEIGDRSGILDSIRVFLGKGK